MPITARAALCLAVLALAACGDEDALGPGESDLFARDVPDREAPLNGAPDMDDLPPEPILDTDRQALLDACVQDAGNSEASCECMADAAEEQMDRDAVTYFIAQVRGDDERAAALESELSVADMLDLTQAAARIALECGAEPAN